MRHHKFTFNHDNDDHKIKKQFLLILTMKLRHLAIFHKLFFLKLIFPRFYLIMIIWTTIEWYCQFYIMKVVKSRAFKDRLKSHKQSVITLFSPFGGAGHMLYSISKDGSVRGARYFIQDGTWRREKSRSRLCLIKKLKESKKNNKRPSSKPKENNKRR